MFLKEFVEAYGLAHDVAPATIQQLKFAVAALDKWHGSPVAVEALADDLLNRWINQRLADGKSRRTVKGQRGAILTLWRAALADSLTTTEPKRVKLVKTPTTLPEAWDTQQLCHLLATAEKAGGKFANGIKRAAYLRAWLLTGYYSGFRPCDMRLLQWSDIGTDGSCVRTQEKTGWPVLRHLPPDAIEALEQIRTDSAYCFPIRKKTHNYWWEWLMRTAKIKGTQKWLRRTCATHCEKQQPGSAMSALGHKTPGLAWRHYIDPRQLQSRPIIPPKIG